jgi:hypothetical protein
MRGYKCGSLVYPLLSKALCVGFVFLVSYNMVLVGLKAIHIGTFLSRLVTFLTIELLHVNVIFFFFSLVLHVLFVA